MFSLVKFQLFIITHIIKQHIITNLNSYLQNEKLFQFLKCAKIDKEKYTSDILAKASLS